MSNLESTEVIIVGAGPTGMSLALMLARDGVRCCVVEQNAGPQPHPAACILNTRTMEVFREIGIANDVLRQAQPADERSQITWVSSLSGRQLGNLNAAPNDIELIRSLSPVTTTVFPQNRLEPLLWEKARQHSLIRILPAHRLSGLQSSADGVIAEVQRSDTGRPGPPARFIAAEYLVGCDGASSATRELTSIDCQGEILQPMISIYFTADLRRYVEHRPSILYWVFNSKLLGVLIAHWLPTEWVLMTPYFPPQESREDFDGPRCKALITAAVGDASISCQVKHVGTWSLSTRMADCFGNGRVYLAGDAAHAFPPTGGLGLNTGVQDAHNLAWKLQYVLRSLAPRQLLDTYEQERRPVAELNLSHSVKNYFNMDQLIQPVGLSLTDLRRLVGIQQSRWFRGLPTRMQRWLVRTATGLRLRRMQRFDDAGARGKRARQALQQQLPHQRAHYCFLGLDLGFAYQSSAILNESQPQPKAADPISEYRPTTWPGSRLPHCWIERDGAIISTLDLVTGRNFQLLIHEDHRDTWAETVVRIRQESGIPLVCTCICQAELLRTTTIAGVDMAFDLHNAWASLSEVGTEGAILVRPDGHVAWRTNLCPKDPEKTLHDVMGICLSTRTPVVRV